MVGRPEVFDTEHPTANSGRWEFPFHDFQIEMMTYEELVRRVDSWQPGDEVPHGLLCDEASKLKNHNSQRSRAAQRLADMIREKYGFEGYVLLMSGTPAPKTPVDWVVPVRNRLARLPSKEGSPKSPSNSGWRS